MVSKHGIDTGLKSTEQLVRKMVGEQAGERTGDRPGDKEQQVEESLENLDMLLAGIRNGRKEEEIVRVGKKYKIEFDDGCLGREDGGERDGYGKKGGQVFEY